MNIDDPNFWNAFWQRLEATFGSVAQTLQTEHPQMDVDVDRYPDDGHAIRSAWLSVFKTQDPKRDEDAAVVVTIEPKDGVFQVVTDISPGAGNSPTPMPALAQIPLRTVPIDASNAWQTTLMAYTAEVDAFVKTNIDILRKYSA